MGRLGSFVAAAFAAAAVTFAPTSTWPGRPFGTTPPTGNGPPPAWIETHSGSLWLAQSSYCWHSASVGVCGDFMSPQYRNDVPTIRVPRGAATRIHFRFLPRSVSALLVPGSSVGLRAARVVEWRPTRSGLYSIDTLAAQGDAAYVVRVRLV